MPIFASNVYDLEDPPRSHFESEPVHTEGVYSDCAVALCEEVDVEEELTKETTDKMTDVKHFMIVLV